jgi:glycosyltransferase involved in cell wall biosynthesis
MKIVLVNKFWYPKGGTERYLFLLKDLLEQHGHEVIPFGMDDERNIVPSSLSHFVSHVDFWDAEDSVSNQTSPASAAARVLWSREASKKFAALLDEEHPDIIHIHNIAHQISPSILPVAGRRNIPVVATAHDYKLQCPNYRMFTQGSPCERCQGKRYWNAVRFQCFATRGASAIAAAEMTLHHVLLDVYGRYLSAVVAPSQFMAEKLESWKWRGRVDVIPNFIPPPYREPDTVLQEDGRVLFVGRLTEEKGVEDFLAATWKLPNVPFSLIGDGPLAPSVAAAVEKQHHVKWLQDQSPDDVSRHLSRAAMVVVPSRWYENAPYVVLEAMASGVPVVATRVGGLPELVRDGVNGAVVSVKDHEALAKSIEMLYTDLSLRRAMGERARKLAKEKYGPEQHYKALMELYTSLPSVA